MTTHAAQPDGVSLATCVAQLPHLFMDSLRALWDYHFDECPNHHHRTWLKSGARLNGFMRMSSMDIRNIH